MTSAADIEQRIRAHIVENFLMGEPIILDSSQSLLTSGILDSTGVMELVMFLEKTFNIKVEDEDLVPEKLDTIANVTRFVFQKSAQLSQGIAGTA